MEENQLNDDLDVNTEKEYDEHIEHESKVLEYFTEQIKSDKPDYRETLKILYELKNIDSELAEIEEEKGDLPNKIKNLKSELSEIENQKSEYENLLVSIGEEEIKLTEDNKTSEEKIYKYDEEKYNVKNNKEYDRIMLTIDSLYEIVTKNETRIKEIGEQKKNLDEKINGLGEKLTEMNKDLDENQLLLSELNQEHEVEELELNEKRNKLLPKLNEKIRKLYEKINGTFFGEAVALVRRGNCSGCYNSIPPQREIEIKSGEDVFLCQSCGRILVDESLIQQ
jgi:uncharacterized protein